MRAVLALVIAGSLACARAPVVADPAPNARLEPAALAIARHGHGAHVLGDSLYVLGGFSGEREAVERGMRDVARFDFASASWEPRAPLVTGEAFFGSAVLAGALHAVGGDVQRYDAERDTWEVVARDVALPESHFACAALGQRLYVLGGYPLERSGFHAFDARTRAVETLAPPPGFEPGDHFAFLAVLAGELHAVGGLRVADFAPSAQHFAYADGTWTPRAAPSQPLWAKFAVHGVVDDALYVFADGRGLRYDARADRWSDVAPLPVPLAMAATFARAGELWYVGGQPLEGSPSTPCAGVYDPQRDAWRVVP